MLNTPISQSLPTLFQTAYANSLLRNTSTGGVSNLAAQALNTVVPGSNPLNPLQGVPALTGLSQFVQGIQQTALMRKIGLLPSTTGGAAGGDPLSMIVSLLGSLGGGGLGGGLGGTGLALDVGGSLPPTIGASLGMSSMPTMTVAGDVASGNPDAQILGQLQSMLNYIQTVLASRNPQAADLTTPQVLGVTQPPVQQSVVGSGVVLQTANGLQPQFVQSNLPVQAPSPQALLLQQQQQQQLLLQQQQQQQLLLQQQAAATPGIGTQSVNFGVVDNAINKTLGSIFSTLPLVNL